MISALCVARDLQTIAPIHLSVRVGDSSRRSEEIVKSGIAPFNAIIILLLLPNSELQAGKKLANNILA